ncbi:hypothetical protein TNCV_4405201 [Trichonephila clavipes]|uniref:Uncharacterized protein n=1 Tax=Trichonephila clavipes TaxID=2585209 RepID=A0A8X6SF50_TRICX|nr:hypothetical protein TNCV_4405201 [Trichonephila clavipes]
MNQLEFLKFAWHHEPINYTCGQIVSTFHRSPYNSKILNSNVRTIRRFFDEVELMSLDNAGQEFATTTTLLPCPPVGAQSPPISVMWKFREWGTSSSLAPVTEAWIKITWFVANSSLVASKYDCNEQPISHNLCVAFNY